MAQTLRDDVKERIARAALIVFAKEGFPGATMSAIAREAGVATGNLYRYYPSKEVLFEDAVSHLGMTAQTPSQSPARAPPPIPDSAGG